MKESKENKNDNSQNEKNANKPNKSKKKLKDYGTPKYLPPHTNSSKSEREVELNLISAVKVPTIYP